MYELSADATVAIHLNQSYAADQLKAAKISLAYLVEFTYWDLGLEVPTDSNGHGLTFQAILAPVVSPTYSPKH